MKKLVLFFALVASAALMTGCSQPIIEYAYQISYVYVNESSSEVTVHSVKPSDSGKVLDSLYVLPVNGQHVLSFGGDYYSRPFLWAFSGNRDKEYVTVSNGEKIVTQTLADNGKLFDMDSYAVVKEENRHKTVEFVFTDAFFDNGESLQ